MYDILHEMMNTRLARLPALNQSSRSDNLYPSVVVLSYSPLIASHLQ